jgi:uncharacterized membrane protein YagU involved in acid resistance
MTARSAPGALVPHTPTEEFAMNPVRVILAGVAGTAVMTMLMLTAPMMGMPKMPVGEMLGTFLKIGTTLGWAMHGVIGLTLAGVYAVAVAGRLPGPPAGRGAVYGFLVFLVAQLAVMPMMGAGVFSGGNVPMIMGSLIGHLMYGAVVGAVYAAARRVPVLA